MKYRDKIFTSAALAISAVVLMAVPLASSAAVRTTIKVSERSRYERKSNYIVGGPLNTTAAELSKELLNNSGLQFENYKGQLLGASSKLGTGTRVSLIENGNTLDFCEVVIAGELTGDGVVKSTDYVTLKKYFADNSILQGVFKKAADITGDGKITSVDYIRLKKYFGGVYNIYPTPENYTSKYLDLTIDELGYDVYQSFSDRSWGGYRYGPTLLMNQDGSYDMVLASMGGYGEADWITYQHSANALNKGSWSTERIVLQPTGNSLDEFSVCDPGAICFGGYYYIGYTSTTDSTGGGLCNSVYVARAKNPEGPYEKWNGSGWGGEPAPLIAFDGEYNQWGAGEPSFVVLDDTVYIYYTWRCGTASGGTFSQMRAATADALDPNWPATVVYQGTSLYFSATMGSLDVAYVEDYDKWIAVGITDRFANTSAIVVYQSDNGISFRKVNEKNTNVMMGCHNIGISKDLRGHIQVEKDLLIGYSYAGYQATANEYWGKWNTRIQRISIGISDKRNTSDNNKSNYRIRKSLAEKDPGDIIGITTDSGYTFTNNGNTAILPRYYRKALDGGSFTLRMIKTTVGYTHTDITNASEVTFSGYDTSIIRINGFTVTPLKTGKTWIRATYKGFVTEIAVEITPADRAINMSLPNVVSFTAPTSKYWIQQFAGERKQVRGLAVFEDGNHCELFNRPENILYPAGNTKYKVTYSIADPDIATIDENGIITAKKKGSTTVTAICSGISFTVPIEVY